MIRLDFTNMMSGSVANGIDESQWTAAAARFRIAYQAVADLHDAGTLGFAYLPADTALLEQSVSLATSMRGQYDDIIILGIGGSALGPIALRTALCRPGWNSLSPEARGGYPRLHVLDNIDPVTIEAVLQRLDLSRSLFVVTSKSGGTAETMSQFLIAHERIVAQGLPLEKHCVFITDPVTGALRPLAHELGVPALDIPSNIGGRFSVLTPVGIFPAALVGINVAQLMAGADAMRQQCETDDLAHNPAGTFAVLQYLSDIQHGRTINVFMPYADSLRDMAAWYVQLWAESLGKIHPDGSHVGGTPLPALGATDQHSQVQLFMEGPPNKVVTFLRVEEHPVDLTMPNVFPHIKELAYLGGHSLGELLNIEQRATAGALAKRGRPNLTIELAQADAWHVGGLIMMLELATAYAGNLYGIDAFNQPGVELGKQFAYALLGRPGAEAALTEWKSLPRPDKRWSVGR